MENNQYISLPRLPDGKRSIMLMSLVPSYHHYKDNTYQLNEYSQRLETLREEGVDLKFFTISKRFWNEGPFKLAALLEEKYKGSVLDVDDRDIEDEAQADDFVNTLNWPRDWFLAIGNNIYRNPKTRKFTADIFSQLGYQKRFRFFDSPIGEGGLSVGLGKMILYSGYEDLSREAKRLEKSGVVALPIQMPDLLNERERELAKVMYNGHADLQLNLAKRNGVLGIVTTSRYYSILGGYVNKIVDYLEARLHVVRNEDELNRNAINFINLPNGKVIVGDDFKETGDFLETIVGKEGVIRFRTIPREINSFGGLRCRTNLIPSRN